jgi:uncharacterized protein YbjT (DUF2867 family)
VVTVESMAMAIGPADWKADAQRWRSSALREAARNRGRQRHKHQTGVRAHQCQGGVTPASVDRDGNACLIEAAAALNAHVVLMSVLGASPTHPMELFRMKAVAEERLRDSATPWTIVRAGAFIELYCDLMRQTARRSGRPLVLGRGENRISFASVPDVAAGWIARSSIPPAAGR